MLGATLSGRDGELTSGHNVERYRSHTVLVGTHVLTEDELIFEGAFLELRGMSEWMSDGSLGVSPYAARRAVRPSPRGLRRLQSWWRGRRARDSSPSRDGLPEPLEVTLEGATLKIGYGTQKSLRQLEETVRLKASAAFEFPAPISLEAWRERWSRPLFDFIVFATREQIVTEHLTVKHYNEGRLAALHPAIRRGRHRPLLGHGGRRSDPPAGGGCSAARDRTVPAPIASSGGSGAQRTERARDVLHDPPPARRNRVCLVLGPQHANDLRGKTGF